MTNQEPFWISTSLLELDREQWESICDGCAKCCLQQLEDEDTNQLVFTDVACDLLDSDSCRCSDYQHRSQRVPECMTLTPANVHECATFAPPTCAYRLLVEGQPLPDWHHLVSGSKASVHQSGNSVANRVRKLSDIDLEDLEEYVVDWP